MKNINFQVKFHVFYMFEKSCFIPILVNRVGLTAGLITTMDQMRSSSKDSRAGKVHTKGSYWDPNDFELTDLTLEIEYLNKYIFFYKKNISPISS